MRNAKTYNSSKTSGPNTIAIASLRASTETIVKYHNTSVKHLDVKSHNQKCRTTGTTLKEVDSARMKQIVQEIRLLIMPR